MSSYELIIKLRLLCETEGYTRYRIEKEAGLPNATLKDLFTDKFNPKIQNVMKLEAFLARHVNKNKA